MFAELFSKCSRVLIVSSLIFCSEISLKNRKSSANKRDVLKI